MSILASILNTLVVILAVLLIALILVQPTKSGGGFGSAFGGLGESVFGAQAMSHLSKLTVWCISIFFILTLASAIIAGRVKPASDESLINKSNAEESADKDKTTGESENAAGGQTEPVKPGDPQTGLPPAVGGVSVPGQTNNVNQEAGN